MLLSLTSVGGVKNDLHLGLEFGFCDDGPSNGVHHKIIAYVDRTAWHYLIVKKDLHSIYLK